MKGRDTPLREATQAQLVEELARRLNDNARDEPPALYCDDCAHFQTWERIGEPPASYNPCAKHHAMAFYVPQLGDDPSAGGYYIEVCPDRTPLPEPTPPEPPPPPPAPRNAWEDPNFRQKPPPRGRKPRVVP